jgi:hypothetical protein
MPPTSRTTFYVNRFVHRDAIGMVVRANAPIVAEQTIFIHHGMTSAIGARSTSRQWLFPAGPPALGATNWIAVVNPTRFWAHVTLNAYGPAGNLLGIKGAWLRPHGRAGYLVNRFGHTADAAVIMTSSRGTVAEQTTYRDRLHDDATESFGVRVPGRGWAFAAANTVGQIDTLDLFNPSSATISVTVQFITASGVVVSRTYLVPPLSHVQVNANGVVPNAQLGIVASSASGFVAANQAVFNNGAGATSSSGIAL